MPRLLAYGRIYCGTLSTVVAALTVAAWRQHSLNDYLLAFLAGLALALATGVTGRPSRVLALAIIGCTCSGFAALIQLGLAFGRDADGHPAGSTPVLLAEFLAAFLGFQLAHRMLRADAA